MQQLSATSPHVPLALAARFSGCCCTSAPNPAQPARRSDADARSVLLLGEGRRVWQHEHPETCHPEHALAMAFTAASSTALPLAVARELSVTLFRPISQLLPGTADCAVAPSTSRLSTICASRCRACLQLANDTVKYQTPVAACVPCTPRTAAAPHSAITHPCPLFTTPQAIFALYGSVDNPGC